LDGVPELSKRLTAGERPQSDESVTTPTDEKPVVWAYRQARDLLFMGA
jgi:hypothetical protein